MLPRELILFLPVGPSVNSLFNNVTRSGRGKLRVPTSKYQQWQTAAKTAIRMQLERWEPISNPIRLSIDLQRPTANSDLSNRIKALEDILVKTNIIVDDKLVHDLRIRWRKNIDLPTDLANLAGKRAMLHLQEL